MLKKLIKDYQTSSKYCRVLHAEMLEELRKKLKTSKIIKNIIKQIEESKNPFYQLDEEGYLERFIPINFTENDADKLSDKYGLESSGDIMKVINDILGDLTCARIDFKNSVAVSSDGEVIIVQEPNGGHRLSDCGVWLDHKKIIDIEEYLTKDREVNTVKRNKLIEKYMEKTGYYPTVISLSSYGDVSIVNTLNK